MPLTARRPRSHAAVPVLSLIFVALTLGLAFAHVLEIVGKLRTALQGILKDPAFHERFVSQGFEVRDETGEAFRAFIRKDVDKWRDVVKASGATLD